ncbi:hypothetical protein ACQ86D_05500 [Streptomyces galilaeus]
MPGIELMHRARVLGPDVVLVHASKSTPDELRLATETGAPIPLSSGTEARMPGLGIPPTGRVPKFGGTPDVSADTEIVASADLFDSLRSLPVVTARQLLLMATRWGGELVPL